MKSTEQPIFFASPVWERGDFSPFLNLYAPDRLPQGRELQVLMNCFVFCVEGWDDDPREIHTVPEIRRFYSAFHDAWPYWMYFCNLDVETLKAMTMCCLPSVNTIQVDRRTQFVVTYSPLDLIKFIKRDFMPMNLICERAEMSERGIYDRTKALFEYFDLPFDLPFDAEPPPLVGHVAPQSVRGTLRVGRNAPCPCGSGKKYKKCCGKG